MIATAGKTWIELVWRIGMLYGYEISDADADFILWNFTGFPAFFHDDAVKEFTAQIHEFFTDIHQAA